MYKCKHVLARKDFCYDCVLEIKADQGQAVEQLTRRFNYIWRKASPDFKKVMIESETKFPITKAQVLASFPIEGTNYLHYKRSLDRAVEAMVTLRADYPTCWIGPVKDSFIIYSKPIYVENLISVSGTIPINETK